MKKQNLISEILEIDPSFYLNYFDENIFSYENLKYFELKKLVENYEYLDANILDGARNNLERFNLIYNDEFKKIYEKLNINPQKIYYNTRISNEDLEMINIDQFCTPECLKFVIQNDIKDDSMSKMKFYRHNKGLIATLDFKDEKVVKNLRQYYNFYKATEYILSQIDDIGETRKKVLIEEFVDEHTPMCKIDNVLNIIFEVVFGYDMDTIIERINDIFLTNEKYHIPIDLYNKINTILLYKNINENYTISEYLDDINSLDDVIDEAEEITKKFCFSDIIKNIGIKMNNTAIEKYEGQNFAFLVHAISGLENKTMCDKIYKDISEWTKNYVPNSIISTSLINQYFMCLADENLLFGFSNLNNDDFISMGPTDIFSSPEQYTSNMRFELARYLPYIDFMNESVNEYNEIVLKRYREKKPILPDYIVFKDYYGEIDNNIKNVANYFNIPVCDINMNAYFDRMIKNQNIFMNKGDYENYINYLNKMYYSFEDTTIIKAFFTSSRIEEYMQIWQQNSRKIINEDNANDISQYLNDIYNLYSILGNSNKKQENALVKKL